MTSVTPVADYRLGDARRGRRAAGTLVLALATFDAVRDSRRTTRAVEQSLQAVIRPLLLTSKIDDPLQKVGFIDGRWIHLGGGQAAAHLGDDDHQAIYLALSLRNIGTGLAVLNSWLFTPEQITGRAATHPDPADFRLLTRDLYIAPNDIGFW